MKNRLLPASKFPIILGISALLIALCAAFFSVYGISTLFAGASVSAMIMASTLELGKLVGTTFLYRYWTKCKRFLKGYLIIAIFVLMAITSLGIFGYLSSAYQKSSIEFAVTQEKITAIETQKSYFKDKIDASKKRIDDLTKLRESQETRMTQVLTNEYISRNPLQLKQLQQQNVDLINDTDSTIKDENNKIQNSIENIQKTDAEINQLKLGTAEKKDVQTFKFVADALNLPLDTVARWFIVFIIFVFDPLAICLVLAYNVAVYKTEDDSVYDDNVISPQNREIKPIEIPKSEIINTTSTPIIEEIKPIEVKSESTPQQHHMSEWFKQMFKI